jgi:hypothetical protein
MKRLLLLLLIAPVAQAGVVVSWDNPTTNTDGTPIPATGTAALASTRVEWGTCSAPLVFGSKIAEVSVLQPATSVDIGTLSSGTYCVRVYARNNGGGESAPSVVQSKTISISVPNPPTIVTITTVAYEFNGNKLGRMVASVPMGTGCIGNVRLIRNGQSYYQVPTSALTFTTKPKGSTFVSVCAAA